MSEGKLAQPHVIGTGKLVQPSMSDVSEGSYPYLEPPDCQPV